MAFVRFQIILERKSYYQIQKYKTYDGPRKAKR